MNTEHPKIFVGDISGVVTVLAINCSADCYGDYFYTGWSCLFCADYLTQCLMCISSTVCDRCNDGYYVDPNSYVCKSCSMFGCMTCLNSGYCTTCL